MNWTLFFTLVSPKRIPSYLDSLIYAKRFGVLSLRKNFVGMITMPEAMTLYKISSLLQPRSEIVEIGCYGGLASAYILAGCKNNGAFLYSIDPFSANLAVQRKEVGSYHNKYYKKVEMDSLNNKPSKFEVERLLRKLGYENFKLIENYSHNVALKWKTKIDLLWVDGNHEYSAVKQDFRDWTPFLKKNGYIVFHDANNVDNKSVWSWGLSGPTRFVKEQIKEPEWTQIRRVDSMVYARKNF